MKKYLLFDLDGTLTDPKVGITTCVQYALKEFGIDEPDLDKLESFIGPPLKDSFMQFYGMSEEQAQKALEKYRERFSDVGMFENEVYAGIPQMLHTLQSKGIFLAVASSKPTVFVEKILEHFNIRKYFKVVVGSELDGTRTNKDEVVQEALNQLFGENPIQKEQVYMIGDRKFDVEGAKALEIESVGVAYGYGSMEELKEAKADYIVRSVEELEKFLLREAEEKAGPKKGLTFQRIWVMLYAFLMFMLVRNVVTYGLNWLLVTYGPGLTGPLADFLLIRDEAGELIGFTGNTSTIISTLGFIGGMIPNISMAKLLIAKTAEDMKLAHLKAEPVLNYLWLGLATIGSVVGLNLAFELLQITTKSEAYRQVIADQYSANFLIGIICYGVITPIAEEVVFRGIIYNYLRRLMKLKVAVILGAFLFGAYHMNSVQGGYAFLMSLLIIYGFEYFGDFKIVVIIHMLANIISYCLSYTSVAVSGFISWPVCIVFVGIAVFALLRLKKQKAVL